MWMFCQLCLAIVIFTARGCIDASTCTHRIVAKEPHLSWDDNDFGEIHVLDPGSSKPIANGSCAWEFSSPDNYLLNVQFVNFTSQGSSDPDCSRFYALIKKTFYSDHLIEEVSDPFCGQFHPNGIRINGTVQIELHYGVLQSNFSMAVLIEASTENCGGLLNESHYGIPLSYNSLRHRNQNIVHCVWNFDFSEELELNLVVSRFALKHNYGSKCGNRFLEIRIWNESNGQSKYIRRECKSYDYNLPTNFRIMQSKHFVVTIHSDRSRRYTEELFALAFPTTAGYSDAYVAVDDVVQRPFQFVLPSKNSKRSINSFIFFKKKRNKDQIFARVENISSMCQFGTVQLWSLVSNEFQRNGSICLGQLPFSIFSMQTSSLVYLRVAASHVNELLLTFFSSNKGCGGLFQLAHGQKTEIKSLNYGSLRNYPPNSDCRWLFMADNNTEFDVIVQKLNFELCCHCDYLRIYQGMQSKSNVLYEICTKPIQDYLIKGGMVLHFHSDYSLQAKGFLIDINAWKACGEDFYLAPGGTIKITSPRYGSGSYPSNYFCQWTIIASDTSTLNVSIQHMDLDFFSCDYDYLEIFKGIHQNITLLHKLCQKPSTNILINGSLTIRFHTDSIHAGSGFLINMRAFSVFPPSTTTTTTIKSASSAGSRASISKGVPSINRTLHCCDKTTQGVKTEVKYTTKPMNSGTTVKNKDGPIINTGKSGAPDGEIYLVGIIIPVAIIVCAAIATVQYLKRRKSLHGVPKEKSKQTGGHGNDRWKKRQSSTLALADMEIRRKSSCPSTSLPHVIENDCYGFNTNVNQSNLEVENPYYQRSTISVECEYASIVSKENNLYSGINATKDDYAYATDIGLMMKSAGSDVTDENQYAYIGNDYAK